jgi:pimeloyl-ACP methyl ester carboxylesterase
MTNWPSNGQYRETIPPSFKPTVVFIHNYGGNRTTTHRYQDMVLDMGYNCFSFDLVRGFGYGTVHTYISQLREVLETVPGPKIVYSFSFPSVSAAAVLAEGRTDIKAWICDGGPFAEIWSCYNNLLTRMQRGNALTRPLITSWIWFSAGGSKYYSSVAKWLNAIKPGFPILSIREEKDRLVPPRAIAKFFAYNPKLNLKVLEIKGADHLEGLKKSPDLYTDTVRGFLEGLS